MENNRRGMAKSRMQIGQVVLTPTKAERRGPLFLKIALGA